MDERKVGGPGEAEGQLSPRVCGFLLAGKVRQSLAGSLILTGPQAPCASRSDLGPLSLVGRPALGEGEGWEQDPGRNREPPVSGGICTSPSASTAIISSDSEPPRQVENVFSSAFDRRGS